MLLWAIAKDEEGDKMLALDRKYSDLNKQKDILEKEAKTVLALFKEKYAKTKPVVAKQMTAILKQRKRECQVIKEQLEIVVTKQHQLNQEYKKLYELARKVKKAQVVKNPDQATPENPQTARQTEPKPVLAYKAKEKPLTNEQTIKLMMKKWKKK